ncbi:MAG: DUF2267 domain-containing protein [Myxococcaceae bacterium]
MNRAEFLSHVADRMGFSEKADAEACVRDVLATLGERLSRLEAEALSEDLPPGVGQPLRSAAHGQDFGLEELYARISRRGALSAGRAREEAIVVCHVVAEAVGEDIARRVRLELPQEIAELISIPEPIERPERVHLDPERRTLAEGHGGGSRPLYAARPDRAHSQSVARSENPHGDTKLSSAMGLTQEREEETLAEGRPGSETPLSEAKSGPSR